MKPYRMKHIPTGYYYQPIKYRGSNFSTTGKIYTNKNNGVYAATDGYKKETFSIYFYGGTRVAKRLFPDNIKRYGERKYVTKTSDWKIEYL